MNASEWSEISSTFLKCLALSAPEQAEVLAECDLRIPHSADQVRAMLAAHQDDPEFLEHPALGLRKLLRSVENNRVPDRIGPFKVIRELGRGGMGAVYLARREGAEFEQQVAIKLIKRGLDTDAVVDRFRRERKILARLEHPLIARLFDGGSTNEGVPYFVMERVEGEPIDSYSASKPLSALEIIALFRRVCEAVHYAHQHLVIHRDIKPGNILVDRNGSPKLLDFGVAKLLVPGDSLETVTTAPVAFTPEYASPEQVRGAAVTTAADIYSLGVILHELLTGQRPTKPGTTSTFSRKLPLDLERVLQKALQEEPQSRYGSAADFSADLERYIGGKPVLARTHTGHYVLSKFIFRHRALVATLTLFAIGLTATTLWATRQTQWAEEERRRAEHRYHDLRQLSDVLLFDVPNAISELPGATAARAMLLSRAVQSLDRLAAEPNRSRTFAAQLADAYQRFGDVQGNPSFRNLGDTPLALRSYRKALQLREPIALTAGASVALRLDLAGTYEQLGSLEQVAGNLPEAIRCFRRALASYQGLVNDDPANRRAQTGLAEVHLDLGKASEMLGQRDDATRHFAQELAIFQHLAATNPHDLETQRNLSLAYRRYGRKLADGGHMEEAYRFLRSAKSIDEGFLSSGYEVLRAREDLTFDYSDLGTVLLQDGRTKAAREAFERALNMRIALAAADPADAKIRKFLAFSYCNLGRALTKAGDLASAATNLQSGLALLGTLLARDPGNTKLLQESALASSDLAATWLLAAQRSTDSRQVRAAESKQARQNFERSQALWESLDRRAPLHGEDLRSSNLVAAQLQQSDQLAARLAR